MIHPESLSMERANRDSKLPVKRSRFRSKPRPRRTVCTIRRRSTRCHAAGSNRFVTHPKTVPSYVLKRVLGMRGRVRRPRCSHPAQYRRRTRRPSPSLTIIQSTARFRVLARLLVSSGQIETPARRPRCRGMALLLHSSAGPFSFHGRTRDESRHASANRHYCFVVSSKRTMLGTIRRQYFDRTPFVSFLMRRGIDRRHTSIELRCRSVTIASSISGTRPAKIFPVLAAMEHRRALESFSVRGA